MLSLNEEAKEKIKKNVRIVFERIYNACVRAGRNPKEIKLVAVSKNFPPEYIRYAYEEGIRDFGENYVQEALSKISALHDLDITWHFLGTIQTNKIKFMAEHFDYIHSLCNIKHVHEFEKRKKDKKIKVLLQVNIGREKTKSGIFEEEVFDFVDNFYKINPTSIELVGLMVIPPPPSVPEDSRKYFRRLREIRDEIVKAGFNLHELSMGMSDDFEVAIEEGATILRIGQAIFGKRKY